MKKTTRDKLIIVFVFLSFSLISAGLIKAQTGTDDSETETTDLTPSPNPTTTESLKNRVNNHTEEVLGEEDEAQDQKRGFIGTVQRVSEEALTVENSKGTQIIPIADQTDLTKGGEDVELSEVAIDEQAIVMGHQVEDDFQPLKVIITEEQLFPKPQLVMIGSVASIEDNSLTIISRENQQETEIDLTTQTEFQNSNGEPISQADIFEALQVIVVGSVDTDNSSETTDEDTASETKEALVVRSLAPLTE